MKPQEKAKELSECFDERMGCYVIDDEKYEQFMQMYNCTKEYIIEKACEWLEDYIMYFNFYEQKDVESFRKAMEEL